MAAYTGTTWVDDNGTGITGTLFTAARMNAMEAGIKDAAEHHQSGTLSARPSPTSANKFWTYYATDDRGGTLYMNLTGGSWYDITHERNTDIFCRVATTAALPTHTLTGGQLVASANGALPSQDGVSLAVGDYILVKDQSAATRENMPWIVSDLGSAGTPWKLDQTPEFGGSAIARPGTGAVASRKVRVSEGTLYADTEWFLATNDPIVAATTGLTWVQHEAKQALSYGTGWTDFGAGAKAAKFYKKDGRVYVSGGAKRTTGSGTTIGTLPVGYRPQGDTVFFVTSTFTGLEQVSVTTGGVITSSGSGGAAVISTLDLIQFDVDA